jgi:hypothetical protein
MRRPELRAAGWNREIEVVGPVVGTVSYCFAEGVELLTLPFVKPLRAIGFACRNAEAPLRRAERAASWAMEFMMIANGIDDGEWSFGY